MFMKTQTFRVYDPSSVLKNRSKTVKIRSRFVTTLDGRAHVEKLRVYCLNVAEVYV